MTTQASMRKTAGTGDRSEATRAAVKKYYIYVVLLVIVVIFSLVKVGEVGLFGRGAFLSRDSVINMLRVSAPILILSGAFTLLMISGYIDLSVGSAMSLAAVVFSLAILCMLALGSSLNLRVRDLWHYWTQEEVVVVRAPRRVTK